MENTGLCGVLERAVGKSIVREAALFKRYLGALLEQDSEAFVVLKRELRKLAVAALLDLYGCKLCAGAASLREREPLYLSRLDTNIPNILYQVLPKRDHLTTREKQTCIGEPLKQQFFCREHCLFFGLDADGCVSYVAVVKLEEAGLLAENGGLLLVLHCTALQLQLAMLATNAQGGADEETILAGGIGVDKL